MRITNNASFLFCDAYMTLIEEDPGWVQKITNKPLMKVIVIPRKLPDDMKDD